MFQLSSLRCRGLGLRGLGVWGVGLWGLRYRGNCFGGFLRASRFRVAVVGLSWFIGFSLGVCWHPCRPRSLEVPAPS